jgi:hypothetical protein
MMELSSELRQLVNAGKVASQPTDADRDRLYRALEMRLGIVGGETLVVTGNERAHGITAKMVASLVAAGVVLISGGAMFYSTLPNGRRVPEADEAGKVAHFLVQPRVSASVASAPPVSSVSEKPALPMETDSKKTDTPVASSHAPVLRHDTLSAEVAILSRAEKELHRGHATSAIALLNEHERKYKNGLLAEERTAAKIQALCMLGRVSDADKQLGRLSPQSLHGETSRQACSAAKSNVTK